MPYKKIIIIHPYTMYPIDLLILFYSEKLVRKSKIEVVLKFLILIVISFLFKWNLNVVNEYVKCLLCWVFATIVLTIRHCTTIRNMINNSYDKSAMWSKSCMTNPLCIKIIYTKMGKYRFQIKYFLCSC